MVFIQTSLHVLVLHITLYGAEVRQDAIGLVLVDMGQHVVQDYPQPLAQCPNMVLHPNSVACTGASHCSVWCRSQAGFQWAGPG